MAVIDLFHKREKRKVLETRADVYQHDELPPALRRQIVMILQATLGPWGRVSDYPMDSWRGANAVAWEVAEDILKREMGVFELSKGDAPDVRVLTFLVAAPIDQALSAVELVFRIVEKSADKIRGWRLRLGFGPPSQEPEDAVEELNQRFREHGVGYQYQSGQIFRLDEDFTHAEVVRPALVALSDKDLAAADEHFRAAHRHYRQGEGSQAMGEALKSLESTLKIICDRRGWPYASSATVKPLLDIVFEKGLLSSSHQSHMAGVRTQLESGLPPVANPNRHGQAAPGRPPQHLVQFALQQAASAIALLAASEKQ